METLNKSPQRAFDSINRPYLTMLLLAILVICSGMQVYKIYRLVAFNRAIVNPAGMKNPSNSPQEVQFARAWFLATQGKHQQALAIYNSLENSRDQEFRQRVKYNMGTIYLKNAAEHWNAQGVEAYKEVVTLVGLAGDAYRQVLRSNSENWDARYNLEYALRINPPPKEVEKADWHGRKSSVFAILPGIPRGGP